MLSKSNRFLKVISLVLISSFLLEHVSFAAGDLKPIDLFGKPKVSLDLPESVATVEDSWFGSDNSKPRTVYLLQDAHTNTSGQFNLAKTLDILLEKDKNLRHVFVEAGVGDSSLSSFRQYGSEEERRSIAEPYLRRGLLHGEEYLDLTSDRDFVVWGVEDLNLYQKSVKNYEYVAKNRDSFQNYLNQIKNTISTLKPRILNPELLSFDEKHIAYQKEALSLTEYFDVLETQEKRLNINSLDYPALALLKELKAKEQLIDFEKATVEEQKAIEALADKDQKELLEFSTQPEAPFKLGSRGEKEKKAFYTLLEEKLKGSTLYPNLTQYFDYLKLSKKLKALEILNEIKALEKDITAKLTTNQDESMLLKSESQVYLLEKLFNLTLTPEEYKEYQEIAKDFTINHLTGFLNKKIMDFKNFYERAVFLEQGYEDMVGKAENFYNLTLGRDKHFVEEMMKKMDGGSAVLITGGFHTPNIKSLLKSKNISYISITPQVFQETNQARYEKLLLNQTIPNLGPGIHSPSAASHLRLLAARLASAPFAGMEGELQKLPIAPSTTKPDSSLPTVAARLANLQSIQQALKIAKDEPGPQILAIFQAIKEASTDSLIKKIISASGDSQIQSIITASDDSQIQMIINSSSDTQIRKIISALNDSQIRKIINASYDSEIQKIINASDDTQIRKIISASNDTQIRKITPFLTPERIRLLTKKQIQDLDGKTLKKLLKPQLTALLERGKEVGLKGAGSRLAGIHGRSIQFLDNSNELLARLTLLNPSLEKQQKANLWEFVHFKLKSGEDVQGLVAGYDESKQTITLVDKERPVDFKFSNIEFADPVIPFTWCSAVLKLEPGDDISHQTVFDLIAPLVSVSQIRELLSASRLAELKDEANNIPLPELMRRLHAYVSLLNLQGYVLDNFPGLRQGLEGLKVGLGLAGQLVTVQLDFTSIIMGRPEFNDSKLRPQKEALLTAIQTRKNLEEAWTAFDKAVAGIYPPSASRMASTRANRGGGEPRDQGVDFVAGVVENLGLRAKYKSHVMVSRQGKEIRVEILGMARGEKAGTFAFGNIGPADPILENLQRIAEAVKVHHYAAASEPTFEASVGSNGRYGFYVLTLRPELGAQSIVTASRLALIKDTQAQISAIAGYPIQLLAVANAEGNASIAVEHVIDFLPQINLAALVDKSRKLHGNAKVLQRDEKLTAGYYGRHTYEPIRHTQNLVDLKGIIFYLQDDREQFSDHFKTTAGVFSVPMGVSAWEERGFLLINIGSSYSMTPIDKIESTIHEHLFIPDPAETKKLIAKLRRSFNKNEKFKRLARAQKAELIGLFSDITIALKYGDIDAFEQRLARATTDSMPLRLFMELFQVDRDLNDKFIPFATVINRRIEEIDSNSDQGGEPLGRRRVASRMATMEVVLDRSKSKENDGITLFELSSAGSLTQATFNDFMLPFSPLAREYRNTIPPILEERGLLELRGVLVNNDPRFSRYPALMVDFSGVPYVLILAGELAGDKQTRATETTSEMQDRKRYLERYYKERIRPLYPTGYAHVGGVAFVSLNGSLIGNHFVFSSEKPPKKETVRRINLPPKPVAKTPVIAPTESSSASLLQLLLNDRNLVFDLGRYVEAATAYHASGISEQKPAADKARQALVIRIIQTVGIAALRPYYSDGQISLRANVVRPLILRAASLDFAEQSGEVERIAESLYLEIQRLIPLGSRATVTAAARLAASLPVEIRDRVIKLLKVNKGEFPSDYELQLNLKNNPKTLYQTQIYLLALIYGGERTRVQSMLALTALGKEAAPAVPALTKALTDTQDDIFRSYIAQTLTAIGKEAAPAVPALIKALTETKNDSVRSDIAQTLAVIGKEAPRVVVLALVRTVVETDDDKVRNSMIDILRSYPPVFRKLERLVTSLSRLAKDDASALDDFVVSTKAKPGQSIAVSLINNKPSILTFKEGNDKDTVNVYVAGRLFRAVRTAKPIRNHVAKVSLVDMMRVFRAFDKKYDRRPTPELEKTPIEGYIYLNSYKNLPEKLQVSVIANELSSIAARRTNYKAIHLIGDDALVQKAFAMIDQVRNLKSKRGLFVKGDVKQFPEAKQVHILTKDLLLSNPELRNDSTRLFITMDEINYDQTKRTVDVIAFNPVMSLMDMVGAIKDLSKDDSAFQAAHTFFERLTGFYITDDEFLGYLQGDPELVKRFALPPAIRAIDINLAMSVWATAFRMAAQAA